MAGTDQAFRTATLLLAKENSYGAGIAPASLTDMYVINTFDPGVVAKTYRTDANKIKLQTRGGTLNIPTDASVELIARDLALGLNGDSVTGSGDPYSHVFKHPDVCLLSPASTAFLQGIVCSGLTQGYKEYSGCCLESFTITGKEQVAVELAETWNHDGRETTKSSATFPTTYLALSYLLGSDTVVKIGPNGGSQTDYSGIVKAYKVGYNFGLKKLNRISNGVYVPGFLYSKDHPMLSVEIDVAADKSHALYGYSDTDQLLTLQMTWTAADPLSGTPLTPARSIDMLVSNCYVVATETVDDVEPQLKLIFDLIDVVATPGPVVWTAKTSVPAYLVGTP
jgi:hypothetical protein